MESLWVTKFMEVGKRKKLSETAKVFLDNEASVVNITKTLQLRLRFIKNTGPANWCGIFMSKNSGKSRAPPSDSEPRET